MEGSYGAEVGFQCPRTCGSEELGVKPLTLQFMDDCLTSSSIASRFSFSFIDPHGEIVGGLLGHSQCVKIYILAKHKTSCH